MHFTSGRDVHAFFEGFQPHFADRENEKNWIEREKDCDLIRSIVQGKDVLLNFPDQLIEGLLKTSDGLMKAVGSLRTTLSTKGCTTVQAVAQCLEADTERFADRWLKELVPFCASTKKINQQNGNQTVQAIISACSPTKTLPWIEQAAIDKNATPRQFSGEWLRVLLNSSQHPLTHKLVDQIEHVVIIGLQDANPTTRKEYRSAFWGFVKLYPSKHDSIMCNLDNKHQKMIEDDDANPQKAKTAGNAPKKAPASKGPSLKDIMARQKAEAKAAKEKAAEELQISLISTNNAETRPKRPTSAQSNNSIATSQPIMQQGVQPAREAQRPASSLAVPPRRPFTVKPRDNAQITKTHQRKTSSESLTTSHNRSISNTHVRKLSAEKKPAATAAAAIPQHSKNNSTGSNISKTERPRALSAEKKAAKTTAAQRKPEVDHTSFVATGQAATSNIEHTTTNEASQHKKTLSASSHVTKNGNLKVISVTKRSVKPNDAAKSVHDESSAAPKAATSKIAYNALKNNILDAQHIAGPTPTTKKENDESSIASSTSNPAQPAKQLKRVPSNGSSNSKISQARKLSEEKIPVSTAKSTIQKRPSVTPPARESWKTPDKKPSIESFRSNESRDKSPVRRLSTEGGVDENEIEKQNTAWHSKETKMKMDSIKPTSPYASDLLNRVIAQLNKKGTIDESIHKKLQGILLNNDETIFKDQSHYSSLIQPLLKGLRSPLEQRVPFGRPIEKRTQLLGSLRRTIEISNHFAEKYVPEILDTIISARAHYPSTSHMVSGLEDTAKQVIDITKHPWVALRKINSSLNNKIDNIHSEAMGLRINSELLRALNNPQGFEHELAVIGRGTSKSAEVRQAKIEYCVGLHTLIGANKFWEVLEGESEERIAMLRYAIARA